MIHTCDNCIDVGAESTAHSIHCSGGTSGSHELPPPPAAAAAEGEHCKLVWLGEPQLVAIMRVCDHTQLVIMDSD